MRSAECEQSHLRQQQQKPESRKQKWGWETLGPLTTDHGTTRLGTAVIPAAGGSDARLSCFVQETVNAANTPIHCQCPCCWPAAGRRIK